jgi:hypothetical protein
MRKNKTSLELTPMSLEFERETYLLRQCFFEVQNELGRGRQEEAYHRACELWFREQRLQVVSNMPHRLASSVS